MRPIYTKKKYLRPQLQNYYQSKHSPITKQQIETSTSHNHPRVAKPMKLFCTKTKWYVDNLSCSSTYQFPNNKRSAIQSL